MVYPGLPNEIRAVRPRVAHEIRYNLPISKLRGVPERARLALKVQRVTTCEQLLGAAGGFEEREKLARAAGLDNRFLADLVRRADMARVSGIGVVFCAMLDDLGVGEVADLATRDHVELHERLRQYNQQHRLARRSPTLDEVEDWVRQARQLPKLLTWQSEPEIAVRQ